MVGALCQGPISVVPVPGLDPERVGSRPSLRKRLRPRHAQGHCWLVAAAGRALDLLQLCRRLRGRALGMASGIGDRAKSWRSPWQRFRPRCEQGENLKRTGAACLRRCLDLRRLLLGGVIEGLGQTCLGSAPVALAFAVNDAECPALGLWGLRRRLYVSAVALVPNLDPERLGSRPSLRKRLRPRHAQGHCWLVAAAGRALDLLQLCRRLRGRALGMASGIGAAQRGWERRQRLLGGVWTHDARHRAARDELQVGVSSGPL